MNDTDGLRMSDDDVFEAEKEYYLEMALTPLTGYEFADSVSFTFGGSNEYVDTPYCRINGSGTADMFSVTLTPKVLKTAVSSVNVNGFTVPKVGDKVSDHLSVSVPAGSGYTISHVHWYSSEFGSISDSDVFEADMDYYISIDLSPLSGYEFASDAKFYINNSEEYTDTIYSKVTADGNARLYSIDLEATSAEQAKTPVVAVNVIGFTVPNAGDRASDRLSVSVPEDSGYSILSVNWYDNENNNYLSGSDTFEAGKTYYLDITLVPLTGYQFTSGVRFYFNGSEEYVDTLYSRLQGETIMLYSIDLTPSDQASKTIIDRIDIVGFSLPYVGTSVGDAVYPTVPDDCGYRITTAHWYFGAGGWMLDGIEFEKDEEIKLCIYLEPLEGYAFSDDTEFYIDGSSALVSPGSHLNANGTAFIYTINVVAAESAKKIEVVNVLGYTEPHADDVANAYVGLTVPGDCGYVISEISWLEAESKVALSGEDKFEDGKSYFLLVKLAPSDGYVFASDPEFLIDGSDSAVDKANSLANNEYTATLLSAEISAKPEIHLSECDINGHTWGEWMQTLEPNCIYGGEQMRVCTVCDAVEKEELYPLGHSLSDQKLDPTCIESGYTRQICERCGEIFDEVEIEPLGHDFGEWLQTLEPTVGEEGEEERVCARCGETETRPLPALDPEPTTADKTTSAPEKTDPAPSGSEQTERTEKSGCDSVIGGTGVAVCMITVGAAAFLAKKKRGDK